MGNVLVAMDGYLKGEMMADLGVSAGLKERKYGELEWSVVGDAVRRIMFGERAKVLLSRECEDLVAVGMLMLVVGGDMLMRIVGCG